MSRVGITSGRAFDLVLQLSSLPFSALCRTTRLAYAYSLLLLLLLLILLVSHLLLLLLDYAPEC